MELRHLRYFVVLAEELHFGRAAQRLHIAQPPLSQQIRALEQEIGVQLFERTHRHVGLTAPGHIFLEEARRTLTAAAEAVHAAQRAQRGEIGHLRIGFVGSAPLARLLRPFRRQFPKVAITLQQLTTSEQCEALLGSQLDLGILRPPVREPALTLKTVLREDLLVALPSGHHLVTSDTISLQILADEPFILYPRQHGPGTYNDIIALCHEAGFTPRIAQEAVEMQTIVSLVAAEFGVSLVPSSVRALRNDGVIYKPLHGIAPQWELALAWHTDNHAPALHALLATMATWQVDHVR